MSTYDRIKTLASNRGWSLQKLALKAGIGINSIYRWKKMTDGQGLTANQIDKDRWKRAIEYVKYKQSQQKKMTV